MGGKPKQKTSYFIKYLTYSILIDDCRFPTAFYALTKNDQKHLDTLIVTELQWLKEHQLFYCVLFDKDFNKAEIYNNIHTNGGKFLTPLKLTKKIQKILEEHVKHLTKRQLKKGFNIKDYYNPKWLKGYRVLAIRVKDESKGTDNEWKWVVFLTNEDLDPVTALNVYKRRW